MNVIANRSESHQGINPRCSRASTTRQTPKSIGERGKGQEDRQGDFPGENLHDGQQKSTSHELI
jgi:hypothetical protein